MMNIPQVKLGIVAVSRDCFPIDLSTNRRNLIVEKFTQAGGELYNCPVTVENEVDMLKAVADIKKNDVNALVVFLGNFGPETPETLLAKYFDGPVMFVAAAEENTEVLASSRGDAYCGMLNCSYNMGLRKVNGYIPEYPVSDSVGVAKMIAEFLPIARTFLGLRDLKIITFGPRPQDFFACNAPIKPLYDLGVEVMENSELDLFHAFEAHANDARIPGIVEEMCKELGLPKATKKMPTLAQYEVTLLDLIEQYKGCKKYVALANKCWPAFGNAFKFVPCYINSRLTARGIPVACEVDIYGALSEFIGICVTGDTVTLLDINNTVPQDMFDAHIKNQYKYQLNDTFMGFHCGNTPINKLVKPELKYQLIMHRLNEPGKEPDITVGTLEGDIVPGDVTFFRLQGNAACELTAYVAHGEILPVATQSFGGIGIFAIDEMERFYRHVLVAKRYPHHGAVAFAHCGKALWSIFQMLGVGDIAFNQPKSMMYKTENPFA